MIVNSKEQGKMNKKALIKGKKNGQKKTINHNQNGYLRRNKKYERAGKHAYLARQVVVVEFNICFVCVMTLFGVCLSFLAFYKQLCSVWWLKQVICIKSC